MGIESFEQIARFLPCLSIAHHIPGRIRLKLGLSGVGLLDASARLQVREALALLGEIEGVKTFRINAVALTCVIEYDTAVIPGQAWHDFLQGKSTPASGILRSIVEQKYREISLALS